MGWKCFGLGVVFMPSLTDLKSRPVSIGNTSLSESKSRPVLDKTVIVWNELKLEPFSSKSLEPL